jgi:SagB-type dehydrogenase family enzyme
MTDWQDSQWYRYHGLTKHTQARLQSSPHFLDWKDQPDPFRRFDGAPTIELPKPETPPECNYFQLKDIENEGPNLSIQTVSNLLYHSLAISAWKEVPASGVRWALRVNPSSGNLHPTEAHLISCGIDGFANGIYHFAVDRFSLEARYQGDTTSLLHSLSNEATLPTRQLTILLTSIVWREAWKYRGRAFRYCHHDLGHALACIVEACRGLGQKVAFRHLFDDDVIAQLFGLSGSDEWPGILITIGPTINCNSAKKMPRSFSGQPNQLSENTIEYAEITSAYGATRHRPPNITASKSSLRYNTANLIPLPKAMVSETSFWKIARSRRSGVEFDGQSGISFEQLGTILRRSTTGLDGDTITPDSTDHLVHLFLYAHRISGLKPGVYVYDPSAVGLVQLAAGDVRRIAMQLSLGQSIAANSAFAVSMIADFPTAHARFAERCYRAVHIESGYIGQGLYLGPECIGTNATGIGAFFDDDVNRFLNLPSGAEVIYHFTVGKAVHDPRLRTLPAYPFEGD